MITQARFEELANLAGGKPEDYEAVKKAAHESVADLLGKLGQCERVLREISAPGWLASELQRGGMEEIASRVCELKRMATAALRYCHVENV